MSASGQPDLAVGWTDILAFDGASGITLRQPRSRQPQESLRSCPSATLHPWYVQGSDFILETYSLESEHVTIITVKLYDFKKRIRKHVIHAVGIK